MVLPRKTDSTSQDVEESPEIEPTRSQARLDALDGISFTVQAGQLIALVGPSGAGKDHPDLSNPATVRSNKRANSD